MEIILDKKNVVYVIFENEKHEGSYVRGIYSLYEHAKEVIEYVLQKENNRANYRIEEYNMDEIYKTFNNGN